MQEKSWYALYTRSRHEKVAAEELWRREIEVFLPLREVVSKWKDRKKTVQFPLFPGYIFANVALRERRLDILKVPSIVSIIGTSHEAQPIPEEQITAVKTLVFSEIPYDPYPEIGVGDRVRVIRGPLRGLEGRLVEKRNLYKFVITVNLIRQSVACEIDAADVEKV